MIDLDDTYRRLAGPWTHEQLAAHYHSAHRHGERTANDAESARPIPLLATAIPPSATVSTAIHTLHALPQAVDRELPKQLVEIAHRNVADALNRCHRALELDSTEHGYSVDEWLPTVYDIAGQLLQSARLETEPFVRVVSCQSRPGAQPSCERCGRQPLGTILRWPGRDGQGGRFRSWDFAGWAVHRKAGSRVVAGGEGWA